VRFVVAIIIAALVILSAPFVREIRDWLRATFPGHFVTIVAAGVGLTLAAAVGIALLRIRDRRAMRYGAIAAAILIGSMYAIANATGNREVDAVERFHFVEYGLVTFLFYRAWRPAGDASVFVMPVLAGLLVGTLEGWLQWFIPGRIGEMRDVFLNGAAIATGLLFSVGVDPPERLSLSLKPGSSRRMALFGALVTLVFGLFVHTVHLGYQVDDAEAGIFRSRDAAGPLMAVSEERRARWKVDPPPLKLQRRSREDQYMSEGVLHVQERNRQWEAGNVRAAWRENLILEKYYAPVLDTPSLVSATGHRWPDAQRADAAARVAEAERQNGGGRYVSMADVSEGRHFIRLWPKPIFWTAVGLLVVAMLGVGFVADKR
jgi:hypothetical protein